MRMSTSSTDELQISNNFKKIEIQIFIEIFRLKVDMPILNYYIFHFLLIDLDRWNTFCEVSTGGSFLFTLQRQKNVCTPGDEAIIKIHEKLFSGIPINFTFFVIFPKLQRIWS